MLDFYFVLNTGEKLHSRCGGQNNAATKEYCKAVNIGKLLPDGRKIIDIQF